MYGAVIQSLASTDCHEEAEALFKAMEFPPGVKSFDAILLSRIRSRSWDQAIALCDQMVADKIPPSPQTIQGLLLAHHQIGGRSAVVQVLGSLISKEDARLDESSFRSASKILFRVVDDNLADFRQHVRDMGERDTRMREISINLVRSVRVAEIESNRLLSPHQTEEDMQIVRNSAWRTATSHLLDLHKHIL
jgi:hypothetical protein